MNHLVAQGIQRINLLSLMCSLLQAQPLLLLLLMKETLFGRLWHWHSVMVGSFADGSDIPVGTIRLIDLRDPSEAHTFLVTQKSEGLLNFLFII
jgi:hypothetical protein